MRIVETGYQKEKTEFFGSKFCIGNGYYGYRGTLEEYTKDQLVACTLSEIFDDSGNGWREPVNVPNGLKCTLLCDGEELSVLTKEPVEHEQALDLKGGFHERRSVFVSKSGKRIEIKTERFASLKDLHLLVMKYAVIVDEKAELVWKSHFDCDIWDINGPHFYEQKQGEIHGIDVVASTTIQNKKKAAVGQFAVIREGEGKLLRENGEITVTSVLEKGKTLEIVKYVSVCKETDCVLPEVAAADICLDASEKDISTGEKSRRNYGKSAMSTWELRLSEMRRHSLLFITAVTFYFAQHLFIPIRLQSRQEDFLVRCTREPCSGTLKSTCFRCLPSANRK